MPPASIRFERIDRAYTDEEMEKIRNGLVPREQDDKWFIYWRSDYLYFHRSWTGYCIYRVRFTRRNDGWHIKSITINRDWGQFRDRNDNDGDRMVYYLIDLLLLGKTAEFPDDEYDDELREMKEWSCVGRAMPVRDKEEGRAETEDSRRMTGRDQNGKG
jgi:hypothetical protein